MTPGRILISLSADEDGVALLNCFGGCAALGVPTPRGAAHVAACRALRGEARGTG